METNNWQLLPKCSTDADHLDIILACDGAASVGQVGHEVAVKLTREVDEARMCCLSAVAAQSKPHVAIARDARRMIVINGCANRCASKILENMGIKIDYEITIAKEGVDKLPTLDFDQQDVLRLSGKIMKDLEEVPVRNQ